MKLSNKQLTVQPITTFLGYSMEDTIDVINDINKQDYIDSVMAKTEITFNKYCKNHNNKDGIK